MASILYDVSKQIKAIEQAPKVHTFLYDTFVQNEGAVDAEDARFDYMKGNVEMAPFVVPNVGGKEMAREKFETRGITFPTIAPERTVDYMQYAQQRSFGEDIGGSLSPEERLRRLQARDLAYLRQAIQMRREWMTAQVIFEGRLDILEYLEGGVAVQATRAADYDFTNKFTPASKWSEAGSDPVNDLLHMADMVHEGQGAAQIAVFGTDVRACLTSNEQVRKMLDNRNAYYGQIEPGKMHNSLQYVGTLSNGMELYCYTGSYRESLNKAAKTFVPAGKIMMGSAKMLRCMHGPVAQVEKEGDNPKVYTKEEVPFRYSKSGGSAVMQRLTSRPMILPYNVDGWCVGTVL